MKQSLALLNIMHARKEEEGAGEGEGGSPRLWQGALVSCDVCFEQTDKQNRTTAGNVFQSFFSSVSFHLWRFVHKLWLEMFEF